MSLQSGGACSVEKPKGRQTPLHTRVGGGWWGGQCPSNDTDHMGDSATCKSMVDNDLNSTIFR